MDLKGFLEEWIAGIQTNVNTLFTPKRLHIDGKVPPQSERVTSVCVQPCFPSSSYSHKAGQ